MSQPETYPKVRVVWNPQTYRWRVQYRLRKWGFWHYQCQKDWRGGCTPITYYTGHDAKHCAWVLLQDLRRQKEKLPLVYTDVK